MDKIENESDSIEMQRSVTYTPINTSQSKTFSNENKLPEASNLENSSQKIIKQIDKISILKDYSQM